MMNENYALICKGVSKDYKIWRDSGSRLKAPVWSLLRRVFDKDKNDNPYYRTFTALRGVNFELKKGESIGIIGRNGSGKSTLLQILAGTLKATTGSVKTNGQVAALLELGSGFNPEFSGRENIYLYASILGISKKELEAIYQDIVEFSELEKFIDQPLKTYSSGMTIRLAFSVRIHLDPDILIIDEALAVGDFYFVQKCTRFIRKFIKDKTLILVTHDLSSVQNLCERCLWLKDGRVEFDGTPKEAVEKYLAYYHAGTQTEEIQSEKGEITIVVSNQQDEEETLDQRDHFEIGKHQNQWEVLLLDSPSDSFGTGEGSILDCRLTDTHNRRVTGIVGGEIVQLRLTAKATKEIESPILGFNLKDRHGQHIFGYNTFSANRKGQRRLSKGQTISATFEFRMPALHPGEYAFTAAFAKGTQESHMQIQWIHEALLIRSESPITHQGLCGIPMRRVTTEIS